MPDVRLLHYFEPTQCRSVSGLDDGKRKTKRGWSPGDSLNLVRVLSVRVNYSQQCRNDINGRWEYSKSIINILLKIWTPYICEHHQSCYQGVVLYVAIYRVRVMEVRLSCYLVLLSTDSKTRSQDNHTSVNQPIYHWVPLTTTDIEKFYKDLPPNLLFLEIPAPKLWLRSNGSGKNIN